MEDHPLTKRQETILRTIIDAHISNGEPVGSKYLAQHRDLSCSSATIRNEMAELEQLGLLEQPHTSAGRVPTEAGYRYYVDTLLRHYRAAASEIEQMSASLRRRLGELDQMLVEASRLASALTNYPGIAVKAGPAQVRIRRFEAIYVDQNKFLLVMMFSSGSVFTKSVVLERGSLRAADLPRLLDVLNELFVDLTAQEITLPLMIELENRLGDLTFAVGPTVKQIYETMAEQSDSDLRVEGVNRLLQYPEYENLDELRNMMTLFEDKEDLIDAIKTDADARLEDGVHVLIGSENSVKVMNNSALIYRPVRRDGHVIGAIGVIGPRRMDYAKVISTIDQLAAGIDRLLEGQKQPGPLGIAPPEQPQKGPEKHD
ncbi:MAG: heat-inducible transcription repressor HrcA [Clostridia bacterium]|nr:heat-inducible transcription repressor HrcA [Clostridia bacterium]